MLLIIVTFTLITLTHLIISGKFITDRQQTNFILRNNYDTGGVGSSVAVLDEYNIISFDQ